MIEPQYGIETIVSQFTPDILTGSRRKLFYRLIGIAIIVGLLGSVLLIVSDNFSLSTINRDISQKNTMKDILIKLQAEEQFSFISLDNDLKQTAISLKNKGIDGRYAKDELENLTKKYPFIENALSVSHDGIILISARDSYRSFEGLSVKNESYAYEIFTHQSPVVSRQFLTIFATPVVSFVEPVFSEKGDHLGVVSVIISPQKFIANITTPTIKGTPYRVRVIEDTGVLLFDSQGVTKGEDVRNISPLKESDFTRLVQEVIKENYGNSEFVSGNTSQGKVTQAAFWTTVGLKEIEWRILISGSS